MDPLGLFLSDGHRIRLKSPMINHSASLGISISLSQFRKLLLPSEVQGARVTGRENQCSGALGLICLSLISSGRYFLSKVSVKLEDVVCVMP
jgi:hypothetical protein